MDSVQMLIKVRDLTENGVLLRGFNLLFLEAGFAYAQGKLSDDAMWEIEELAYKDASQDTDPNAGFQYRLINYAVNGQLHEFQVEWKAWEEWFENA